MELPHHPLRGIWVVIKKTLNFKTAIKAVLATKKLGEHLRRDGQHMRVTGAAGCCWMVNQPTNQPAKGQMAVVAAQQLAPQFNEMLEGGCSTWSFVSHPGPTTKTRQPSPTKALYSARAFTGETKIGRRWRRGALVERTGWRGETDA